MSVSKKRQEDMRKREAEEQRFNQLVAALGGQPVQQGSASSPTGNLDPELPPTPAASTPVPKATVIPPHTLSQVATMQDFKKWRQQWEAYAVLVDFYKQPQTKKLIQLQPCLSPEMRRTLERKKQAGKQSVHRDTVDCRGNKAQPRAACDRCGGRPHPKDRCPAVDERCCSCGKVGHYARRCRSKPIRCAKDPPGVRDRRGNVMCVVGNPRNTETPSCSAIYTTYTRAVDATSTSLVGPTSPSIKLQVQLRNQSGWVECMPDTGAYTTVMVPKLLSALGLTSADLRPSIELGLSNPDGTPMYLSPPRVIVRNYDLW
ncbi:hypothetical protein Pcinc_004282 [Petrolisthes cinctipes]|uniref:CCHC-type domain-containing protein n=1 Tax=Petrolisthes cinctipes TaxID=88211 RepID=A0AAE1GHB6_PETCI|nr:hypothetical protein Pcinc_004282 [Petrolisthes cinctipes]